jgi:hypothetical protein
MLNYMNPYAIPFGNHKQTFNKSLQNRLLTKQTFNKSLQNRLLTKQTLKLFTYHKIKLKLLIYDIE